MNQDNQNWQQPHSGEQPLGAPQADAQQSGQSTSQQPFDQQGAGQGPSQQQPAGQQPLQSQPTGQQPTGQQPLQSQPTGQPFGQQGAGQRPTQQQPAGQQPVQPQQGAPNPYAQRTYAASQVPFDQRAYAAPSPYAAVPHYTNGYPPQQKKSHGWIIAIVIIVCLFGLMAYGISSCSNAFSSLGQISLSSSMNDIDTLSSDAVGVIDLAGVIQYDKTECSPEGLKELLDQAEDSPNIKAVVLRVNSGGGAATAGEEMAHYIAGFSKPVVISSASINASAAYWISSQADYLYVAKTTEIGDIGTAMQVTDLSGLMELLGIDVDTITSTESKDSSYGTRPLTEDERAYYQNMINEINEVFITDVADGRGMSIDEVRTLATGLPFTGTEAVENGLADEVGTREDAIAKAAELGGIKGDNYTAVPLELERYSLSDLATLFSESNSHKALQDFTNTLEELDAERDLIR